MKVLAGGLIALSLIANGVLGYMFVDERDSLRAADQTLTRASVKNAGAVADLEKATSELESAASSIQSDVQTLQTALRAVEGLVGDQAAIDKIQDQIVGAMKSCVNDAFEELKNYAERIAAYVGILATGGFAVQPRFFTPQCF